MAKKTARDSLGRIRTGIGRETPASRTAENEEGQPPKKENIADRSTRTHTTERKVRVSVDLPRVEHKYLRDFAYDAESDAMSVMRTLLKEMADNEELAGRIHERLSKSA